MKSENIFNRNGIRSRERIVARRVRPKVSVRNWKSIDRR